MDFEKIKDFARKGLLLKEIVNCQSPLYSFCIQAKQQRASASRSTLGGSIKEGDLKPSMKISYDQYQSSEQRIIAINNGQILTKSFVICGTLFADYAFDFIFNFN